MCDAFSKNKCWLLTLKRLYIIFALFLSVVLIVPEIILDHLSFFNFVLDFHISGKICRLKTWKWSNEDIARKTCISEKQILWTQMNCRTYELYIFFYKTSSHNNYELLIWSNQIKNALFTKQMFAGISIR